MATLDKVMDMKKQGISDAEITTQLQNEGVSPSEINDSLNQAKIKNAISPPEQPAPQGMQESIMPTPPQPGMAATQPPVPQQPMTQEVQPPVPQMQPPVPQMQPPVPQPQAPAPEIYPPQEQFQQAPQEDYYQETPQAYPQQDYYAPQGAMDTETISEIAEQVTTEKLNEFKKKIGDITSFKTTIQDKVSGIDERLKRIEASIDNLQQSIIGKVGELGESNAMVHKDLDNLHGTVSKLMNPLIDNINEMKKISK
jgi:hypothetical protein